MRTGRLVAIAFLSCAALSAQDATFFRDTKAKDLFAAGRIAVSGGPNGLARLRSLSLNGQSRFPGMDGAMVDGRVEIRILLPDRYLRIDSGAFGRRLTGYAGSVPLNSVETADRRFSPVPNDAGVLQADRAELARLMLGIATYASEEMPLKLMTRETQVEMPGVPDALGVDVIGEKGFTARVVFDATSRAPARLMFWSGDHTALITTFLDRKTVSGLRVPHRIVTTAADRVVDELSFDDVIVNPALTKADFTK